MAAVLHRTRVYRENSKGSDDDGTTKCTAKRKRGSSGTVKTSDALLSQCTHDLSVPKLNVVNERDARPARSTQRNMRKPVQARMVIDPLRSAPCLDRLRVPQDRISCSSLLTVSRVNKNGLVS